MLRRITSTDPLWENPPFLHEEGLYNLLYSLRQVEDGLFLTDGETVFIARTSPAWQAWVWVAEGAPKASLAAVDAAIDEHGIDRITAKPWVIERLCKAPAWSEPMYAQVCPRLIPATPLDGALSPAWPDEIETIAAMLRDFTSYTTRPPEVLEAYLPDAQAYQASADCAFWRAPDGTLAAMANCRHHAPRHARIGPVYTAPAYRGRGYAAAVVAALCERILADGKTPMLYTDAAYPPSNRCYAKIGFVIVGKLYTERTR